MFPVKKIDFEEKTCCKTSKNSKKGHLAVLVDIDNILPSGKRITYFKIK